MVADLNRPAMTAPGPEGHPELGSLPELQQDPLLFLVDSQRRYGDVVRLRIGADLVAHMVSHPDFVRHVLQDNSRNYTKGAKWTQMQAAEGGAAPVSGDLSRRGFVLSRRFLLGNGLLTSEGEFWRRQRRLEQPAFHRKRLSLLTPIMTGAIGSTLSGWLPFAESGEAFDVAQEMMHLALKVVGQTLFGLDLRGEDAAAIDQGITQVLDLTHRRAEAQFDLPDSLPPPGDDVFQQAVRSLEATIYRLVEGRRLSGTDTGDLLSMLVFARDEEAGESMTNQQLRDEILTIFLAGHETTAQALAWTFYLLSQHPAVERRLHIEVEAMLGGRTPEAEDLPNLPYTRMVIDESLRLYPPAWLIMRNAIETDSIGGCEIPAGSDVLIIPYVIHRHPDFWLEPDRFDPERFTPDRVAQRPRFAYIPFGGGPRLCIGNNFALMEAQLALAMIAQQYRLQLVPGQRVEPQVMFSLRPRGGLPMTLLRRDDVHG